MGEENTQSRSRRKRYEPPWIWLWLAGRDLDEENGKGRTDATWTRDATRVFYPYSGAPVSRWSKMAHWKRSTIRQSAVLGSALIGWDYWHHPSVTILGLSLLTVIILGHHIHQGTRRFFPLRHYWQWVRPFSHTLKAELGIVPQRLAITAHPVTRLPVGVTIELPDEYLGSDHERAAITKAVEQKLAIEAPEASWNLVGREHTVKFTHSPPPPSYLTWDDVKDAVAKAKPDELVVGLGKNDQPVIVSLESDSPHLGIGMGTGAGKSNLAAFWLVQRLMRGDMVAILDGKRTSHPWAFKNMDYEYDQLPNVAYARRTDDIHNLLCWLGAELHRRNELSEDGMNARGHLRDSIGNDWDILFEEMNMVTEMLKEYWDRCRELAKEQGEKLPKRSPALLALGALAYAGRAVGMRIIFLGQRLDAECFGVSASKGGSVRGQVGARALARYDEQSWAMQAGKGCPMPPSPSVTGRIQMWLGGDVYECQVPHMEPESDRSILRELAVSGIVTPCPPGMPGTRSVAVPRVPAIASTPHVPSDQPIVPGHAPQPSHLVTLREALAQNIVPAKNYDALRKDVQRKGIRDYGKRGKHNLYDRADLYAMQQPAKELVP